MTPAELRALSRLPGFPATATELIHVAGLEGAAALIHAWPGQSFPVPARIGGSSRAGTIHYARLVEIAGEAAAAAIVRHWGGTFLYVPSCKGAKKARGDDKIRAAYDKLTRDGWTHDEATFALGVKYGIAGRSVERMLKRPDTVLTVSPNLSLF